MPKMIDLVPVTLPEQWPAASRTLNQACGLLKHPSKYRLICGPTFLTYMILTASAGSRTTLRILYSVKLRCGTSFLGMHEVVRPRVEEHVPDTFGGANAGTTRRS